MNSWQKLSDVCPEMNKSIEESQETEKTGDHENQDFMTKTLEKQA
jgi:hypothetical protein